MRIAIIGAGLAGLTAAYELRNSGNKVDVYEATDRLGGLRGRLGLRLALGHDVFSCCVCPAGAGR